MPPSVKGPRGTLCDGDTSALVIDGANAICGRAPSTSSQATTLVAALAFAAVWAFAPVRWRRRALVLGCMLAVPGIAALACRRGDAPSKVALASARVTGLEATMRGHAQTYGCAAIERNDCEECQPIVRLALAHAGPCESGATIVLGEDALDAACTAQGPRLVCGGVP